ncbi:MAG: ribosomal protein L7/L12 [Nitrospira sp.]
MKIRLIDCGPMKIACIKVVRQATGLNLKDAKAVVDCAPSTFDVTAPAEQHKEIIQEFSDIGAKIIVEGTNSLIDKVTAASYISTAEAALGEGNISEAKICLKSALRLLGDMYNDVDFVGVDTL